MPAITITDLQNAKEDVDHIAELATSSAPSSTDRLGQVKFTLSALLAQFPNVPADKAAAALSAAIAQSALAGAEAARDLAAAAAGAIPFATKALMDADLAHAAGAFALVYADTAIQNNGMYYKVGGSGAGSWQPYQGDRMAPLVVDTTAKRALVAWEDTNGNIAGRIDALDAGLYLGADTTSIQQQIKQSRRDAYAAAVLPLSVPLTTAANVMARGDLYAKSRLADQQLSDEAFILKQPLILQDAIAGEGYRIATAVNVSANKVLVIFQNTRIPNISTDVQNSRLLAMDITWDPVARSLTYSASRMVVDFRSITTGGGAGVTAWAGGPVLLRVQHGTNAGRIYLFFTSNKDAGDVDLLQPTRAYVKHSDDDGQTWSAETQITAFDNAANGVNEDWQFGSGPKAIQLRYGQYAGRLVVPAYIYDAGGTMRFVCGYSENGGAAWSAGSRAPSASNETAIAEDLDGTVYAVARKDSPGTRFLDLWQSTDGCATWTLVNDDFVGSAYTQASLLQAAESAAGGPKFLLTHCQHASIRGDLQARLCYGRPDTFHKSLQIDAAQAGYSVAATLGSGDYFLVLYENDENYIATDGSFVNVGGVMHSLAACVFNINAMS